MVFMLAYPHIDRYYDELSQLIEYGGLANEENIRSAFQNCLAAYCAEHSERLVLVPELRSDRSNKPDGTIRDSLRMTRGLWEAKDTYDDLNREIRKQTKPGLFRRQHPFRGLAHRCTRPGPSGGDADGHDQSGCPSRADSKVPGL